MKKLLILLNILLLVLVLPSCGGEDEPQIDDNTTAVTPESVEFTAAGGSRTVSVRTEAREWDATTDASWLKLTKNGTSGKSGSIEVTAEANPSVKERSATVTVMAGRARVKIPVSQSGKEPGPTDKDIEMPEGYSLVWHDEFAVDGKLDKTSWTHEVHGPGWVNNELQTYVRESFDGKPVTEITNGNLKINCFKHNGKVYSGRVYANVNTGWKYGIVEARIKLPKGRGTWPAFWMMPANNDFGTTPWPLCGEIDIMEEVGYNPNYTSSSLHTDAYNHTKGTQKTAERLTAGAQNDFHVYRLEWTEDYIRTYVDGKMLLSFSNDRKGDARTWPFNKAFYVILNLAWGGDWGGAQGVDEGCLPATMEVDYVRVFQKD